MDIAAASMSMANTSVELQAGIAVAKSTMEAQEAIGMALVEQMSQLVVPATPMHSVDISV